MALEQREISAILETAIVAARLAGQRAMEEIRYIKSSVKGPDQLVTQADVICQKIIIDRIKETYPDDGFIAEEGPDGRLLKQPPRGDKKVWWVIDPIDGTTNFAKGMLLFAVAVAAIYEGVPVVGVIYDPATDSMFTGIKGDEARLNGRQISVSDDGFDKFSSIGTDSFFDNGVPKWVIAFMEKARSRTIGSSCLQMAYLAKGSLIGVVFVRPKIWDIAAGAVIAESAGASVSDWYGNKIFPIDCDKYEGAELPTLAANKKVYRDMLELLK
ncbi:MAG: inositol monophosphatase [Sedimentisphaerales bacterium]|nr:inositol monophosphatase [Sedimentisphaerales bacterium]